VQKRGAAVLNARKASSAMSAAKAACDHMRSLWHGTPQAEWVSMGVFSEGQHYGAPNGVMFSFPGEILIIRVSLPGTSGICVVEISIFTHN
jgi:malate dehydrogenase